MGATTPGRRPRTGPTRPSRARSAPSRARWCCSTIPNQPFVVTQPKGSTVFGNPSAEASGVPRDQVAQFYEDFLNTPNALNRGHTMHEYWMEDSGGRYGVELTAFGPYHDAGQGPRVRHRSSRRGTGMPGRRHAATGTSAPTAVPRGWPTSASEVAERLRLRLLPQRRAGRVVDLAGVRPDEVPDQGGRDRRLRAAGPGPAELDAHPLRRVDLVGGGRRASGPTPAAARRPRRRAPGRRRTPTSSATSSASATTTTTRTACRRGVRTAGPGRCSAAARSTGRAARTAAG